MAPAHKSGSVLQTWLPHPLDEEFRQHCADERRSLSSAIRIAVEDRLEDFATVATAKADGAPAGVAGLPPTRGAAPAKEED